MIESCENSDSSYFPDPHRRRKLRKKKLRKKYENYRLRKQSYGSSDDDSTEKAEQINLAESLPKQAKGESNKFSKNEVQALKKDLEYLEKLKKLYDSLTPGAETPKIPSTTRGKKPVELTVTRACTIPPHSSLFVELKPMTKKNLAKDSLYLVDQDYTDDRCCVEQVLLTGAKGLVQIHNFTKKSFTIKPDYPVARGHSIEYVELPKYDNLFDSSEGHIINQISTSMKKDFGIDSDNRQDLPSEISKKVLAEKIADLDPKLKSVIQEFEHIFIQENPGDKYSFMNYPEVTLPVKPNAPSYLRPPYKKIFSEADQAAVDIWIQQSLASGLIEKANNAPIASPLLVVRKMTEHGEIKRRFIVDNRLVNKSCLENIAIAFPDILDGIRSIGTDGIFTSLDVKSAFFRLRVDKKSRKYTTFISQGGKYVGTYSFVSLTQGGIGS